MSQVERDKGDFKRPCPSGAEKRKKKKAEVLAQAGTDSKQLKLSGFFTPPSSPSPSPSSPIDESSTTPSQSPSPSPSPDVLEICRSPDPAELNLTLESYPLASASRPRPLNISRPTEQEHLRSRSISISPTPPSPFSPSSLCSVELLDDNNDCIEIDDACARDNFDLEGSSSSPFAGFGSLERCLSECEKERLISMHPVQPEPRQGHGIIKLPFDREKVYYQGLGEEKRMWLSYCAHRKLLYCWVCYGFGDSRGPFATSGWGSEPQWRGGHCYGAITAHEKSVAHLAAVQAFFTFSLKRSVGKQLTVENLSLRARQVNNRREVVLRIINIIVFLAQQSIAFRGDKNEAAYMLTSPCNHGNFLEEIKSRARFDPILRAHLDSSIAMSQQRHDAHPSGGGRGSLVTFMSNSTFKKILNITADLVLSRIRLELELNGGKFSLSMDGCQDISVKEQMATVIRYVTEFGPVERLIDITALHSTSSEALLEHALKVISEVAILSNLVGYSFDGAGNMAGIKTGLQARLKELVPHSIFQHCLSHVLNLVLEKSCNCVTEAVDFFDLMRETASSISESYKRTDLWNTTCKIINEKILMLVKQNKTRWWSKAKGLRRIYCDDKPLLPVIIVTLEVISRDTELPGRSKAKYVGEMKKWCTFETLAVGMLFLQIFNITQPVSDYLQSPQIDHVQAARLTMQLVSGVSAISLDEVLIKAKNLAETCNRELDTLNEDPDFVRKFGEIRSRIETECPRRRVSVVPRRHGERAGDERRLVAAESDSPNYSLKVHALMVMKDRCLTELRDRFNDTALTAFKACSFLSPQRFEEIVKDGIPGGALDTLCALAGTDSGTVTQELVTFAKSYESLRQSIQADFDDFDYRADVDFQNENDYQEDEDEVVRAPSAATNSTGTSTPASSCPGCLRCPYRVLRKHGLFSSAFRELAKLYRVALTLPCTQVTCERCFSRMKIIKNRLRNRMEEELLRNAMIISVEREIVAGIDLTEILEKYALSSDELTRLLIV